MPLFTKIHSLCDKSMNSLKNDEWTNFLFSTIIWLWFLLWSKQAKKHSFFSKQLVGNKLHFFQPFFEFHKWRQPQLNIFVKKSSFAYFFGLLQKTISYFKKNYTLLCSTPKGSFDSKEDFFVKIERSVFFLNQWTMV